MKTNSKKVMLLILSAVLMIAFCVNPAASAGTAQHIIKIGDTQPEGSPIVNHLRLFGEFISKATDGRIIVEVYPAGMLGDGTASLQQVQLGTLTMYRADASQMYDFGVESMKVPGLPYLFRTKEHCMKVMYGDIGQQMLQDITDADVGFVGIGYLTDSARCLFARKRVDSLAAAKGLKTRSLSAQVYMEYKAALGFNPVPMPFSEVYTSLSTGVIDGAWNSIDAFVTNKMNEVCKYFIWTDTLFNAFPVVFSTISWKQYSPEDQKLIKECWQKAADAYDKEVEVNRAKFVKEMEESGVEFVELTDKEAWAAACEPIIQKYSAGYEELVAKIRAMQ